MSSHPVKLSNDELDPIGSYFDRLFMFWQCYVEEERLLAAWHNSTANNPARGTNVLFDSFCDSWGKGTWDEVATDDVDFENVDFEKRSYFQALGLVSRQMIEQMWENVLKDFLEKANGSWRLRQGLSPEDRIKAEQLAEKEVNDLRESFEKCRIPSMTHLDKDAEGERDSKKCEKDPTVYLDAMARLVKIELRCEHIQATFLREGKVLPA